MIYKLVDKLKLGVKLNHNVKLKVNGNVFNLTYLVSRTGHGLTLTTS